VSSVELADLRAYERAARRSLPRHIYDHIAGGAHDEVLVRRNRTAFQAITVRPRYLRDVSVRDLATTMLGAELSMPIFASSAGNKEIVHREGDAEVARATGLSKTLMVVPARTTDAIARVASAASGPLWLQVSHTERDTTAELVRAAEHHGYLAVCPVVDAPVIHPMERDVALVRLGITAQAGPPRKGTSQVTQFTWDDLEWLRGITQLPIVLKGITHPDDARMAVERGVAAVFVSNHGARWNDATMSSVECLAEVVDAVAGRAEVYLDSGVRRGSDVLKALALGARAVGLGRALFWGLAQGGADGVHRVLEILRAELDVALAYAGATNLREVGPDLIDVPLGWGSSRHAASRGTTAQR
jgi:4-hydroxymandelate oxidase